jgi:glycine/D-amino acid oxidase-like deaminating enzyme
MTAPHVAVLGAGILGSSLSIFLARRGARVTLYDKADEPMAAASRWNEGKIHLGYLYGADPSLRTAAHMLPGGLAFASLVSQLIEAPVRATTSDDTFLIHRDSVVDADRARAQFEAVSRLVREHPDAGSYLVDVSDAHVADLSPRELAAVAGDDIIAGYRVPERSVHTRWLADRLVGAVAAEDRITVRPGSTVVAATPMDGSDGPWEVRCADGGRDAYDVVVNALWSGRLPVDVTARLDPEPPWSHRYRLCVFARTRSELDIPSALVAVGPFGDVKNYDGRDFYLSWYPSGLVAEGEDLELAEPEPLTGPAREGFIAGVRTGLGAHVPGIARVFDDAEELVIGGGFVFARGTGSIGDRASSLHTRDRFGVRRRGSYYSVDTGKYSTAPWMAQRLAAEITS